MTELLIRKSIEIDAPIETLWKVLTDSQFIRQYMFGCNAETEWKTGSPLLWRGAADGKLYVKGHVVSIDPPHRLAYTIFDPNSTIPDIPANYLTMTCELKKNNDRISVLEITQGDFSTVADGDRRYRHSLGGDDIVLQGIKQVAEAESRVRSSRS
ncbi:MAG: SRPBCC domain-containing protein [Terriglobales bacterium]